MSAPKVVIMGMLTKIPVGGVVWLIGQYAVGFQRLGFDVYYVEAHGRTPSMFMETEHDDGVGKACAFLESQLGRFGLSGKWAYHALHEDGACYGLSLAELRKLYRDAALIINLHGGTVPLDEHAASGRLVYMGTDPVDVEIEVSNGVQQTIDYLEPHVAFFTWGLNYGNPDCLLPWSERFPFVPSPPPVVMDFWQNDRTPGPNFTTIGNWRQEYRDIVFNGERYTWSKHHEFLKVIELPGRSSQAFELALSSYTPDDQRLLEANGWAVRPGLAVSSDAEDYRAYIQGSRGEFSVAKDQNVRLQTGWFSERSATYLAAGCPVVVQDTGVGNALPTGSGLHSFTDLDTAAQAIETVNRDYERHRKTATDTAREFLNYDVVLTSILTHLDTRATATVAYRAAGRSRNCDLPGDLVVEPISRQPMRLPPLTLERVLARPVPAVVDTAVTSPDASIVVVTYNNLAFTRMALESVLSNTDGITFELIVVDNASTDDSRAYLSVLASRNRNVRVILNSTNRGFAAANNQGLEAARGSLLVLLNNDTIVTPGWLRRLDNAALDATVGLVVPTTNRCGNVAEVGTSYIDYGELLREAARRAVDYPTDLLEMDEAIMFCTAMRRDVYLTVGALDEQFEIGMFEDDDYSVRLRGAGFRIVCVEAAFVHHFGGASLGELATDGSYGRLFHANRERFERKWNVEWKQPRKRANAEYERLVESVRAAVTEVIPPGSVVSVMSRGEPRLVKVRGRTLSHFPSANGEFRGWYPRDDREAIADLEAAHAAGTEYLVIPAFSRWWLGHYTGLAAHLDANFKQVSRGPFADIYLLGAKP